MTMRKMSEIDESAWGDMMRRSSGEIIRKEDDINNLDMSEMYEYILSKYETTDNRFRIYFDEDDMPPVIGMLIFRKDEKMYSLKLFSPYISGKIRAIRLNSSTSETDDEVLKVLLKKFRVEVTPDNQLNITKYNYSVTSPVTNQLCIDVIDTIIENAKEPLIKKKDE